MFSQQTETVRLNLQETKFLIVEDHDFTQHLLVEVLRAFGAGKIVTANNGKDAIALLRTFTPDVVITDCWMAPVGGIALTKFLRTDPASPNPFMPIIMVTTDTRANCAQRARDAGVNELLIKPFWPRALYDRITQAILTSRPFVSVDRYFGPDRRRMDPGMSYRMNERRADTTLADLFPGTPAHLGIEAGRLPLPA